MTKTRQRETELTIIRRRMMESQEEFEARSAQARRRITDLSAELEMWRRQAQQMRASLSWRVTEPVRRATAIGRAGR